mgnify:CR=1 FL=1
MNHAGLSGPGAPRTGAFRLFPAGFKPDGFPGTLRAGSERVRRCVIGLYSNKYPVSTAFVKADSATKTAISG